jgi:hypothetical protein
VANWTKESVEREIRSQGRNCRGPRALPSDIVLLIQTGWENILSARNWVDGLNFQLGLEDGLGQGHVEIAEPDWESLNRRVRSLWDLRVGCGYNINDIICAGLLDGKVHVYNCPHCGLEAKYIPGIFEGVPSLV